MALKDQPEINIGLVGHVDHGKTTLTKALSGKWTDTHSEELKRGITIRLGYANSIFYKCDKCGEYSARDICPCGEKAKPVRKVSFVDAPGHESLMATMLCGAAIIDGALLLVSAAEECPQPQTREHILALEVMGIKNLIIVQNKIDLVSEEEAVENYRQIKEFLKDSIFKDAPIIPISARSEANIGILIGAIEKYIPTPKRDESVAPVFFVARSFDINKPGTLPKDLKGGILGGAMKEGRFNVGDEIIITPSYSVEERNKKVWKSLKTKIVGLMVGNKSVKSVIPGGSIGILTELDPSIVKSDSLAGAIAGYEGKLPELLSEIKIRPVLFKADAGEKKPIRKGELLMLNINSSVTVGVVVDTAKDIVTFSLRKPVAANKGDRVAVSRRIENRFRLVGYGNIE